MDSKTQEYGEKQEMVGVSEYEFLKLCEREIVKIREMTLKDDKYTGGLLGDAVSSPVGVTMCVEARMEQIAFLEKEHERLVTLNARLAKQIAKLRRNKELDEGFIDFLTDKSNSDL